MNDRLPEGEVDERDLVRDRVSRPYAIEAAHLVEGGEAGVAQVDGALQAAGYPVGPFRRLDRLGLDAELSIDQALEAAYPSTDRFHAPVSLVELVSEGRTGVTAGRGFYRYAEGVPAAPGVGRMTPTTMLDADIVERLELAMVNEAYRVVEEGLMPPPLIDELIRETGTFPRGPFEIVDSVGLRRAVERLRAIHIATSDRTGDQYVVAPALWQTATV